MTPGPDTLPGVNSTNSGGYGLPFAYDPLWRYQTVNPSIDRHRTGITSIDTGTFEARFGAGLGFHPTRPSGDGNPPSAHGLQRLTNFNRPFMSTTTGNRAGHADRHRRPQHLRVARGRGLAGANNQSRQQHLR